MNGLREFMCISTEGLSRPPNITDEEFESYELPPNACWEHIVNHTAEHNLFYIGNDTACIINLPPDVRAAIIRWMTEVFADSPINCHIKFANDETANAIGGYVMLAMLFISMLCLILTVVVYAIKKELCTVPGLNLACLCISHFIHYLLGCINLFNIPHYSVPKGVCMFFGFTRHFSILSTFFWLNVMAYDIWRTIVQVEMSNSRRVFHWKRFLKYSIYAWGMALAFSVVAVIFDSIEDAPTELKPLYRRPHLNDPDIRCTMKTANFEAFLIYNIIPRIAALFANIVFFILTTRSIHETSKSTEAIRSTRKAKTRFNLYVKLFIVMGLAWILNAVDYIIHARMGPDWVHSGPKWFNLLTTYFTILIGVAIYVTFGLVPTISIIRGKCCKSGKNENRLSSQSTLHTTVQSTRLSNGSNTISTKL